MQRGQQHPVTHELPVLVPATPGEASDGFANFDSSSRKVRLVTKSDLHGNGLRRAIPEQKLDLFLGATSLKAAHEKDDQPALEKAYQKLSQWLWGSNAPASLPRGFSKDRRWARLHLPQLVTSELADVRIVLWWCDTWSSFSPALYCPDLATAVMLKGLWGDLRVCPWCTEPFVPGRPDQQYCRPAHREAHRVARWRAKQKAHPKAAGPAGRKPR